MLLMILYSTFCQNKIYKCKKAQISMTQKGNLVVVIGNSHNTKNISGAMNSTTRSNELIVVLGYLYKLDPVLSLEYSKHNLLLQECCNPDVSLPINRTKYSRDYWEDNEKRLESQVLIERKGKSAMKIIRTQGRTYFTRK